MSRVARMALAVVAATLAGAAASAVVTVTRVWRAVPGLQRTTEDTLSALLNVGTVAFVVGLVPVAVALPTSALLVERHFPARTRRKRALAFALAVLLGALVGAALLKGPFGFPYNIAMGIFWAVAAAAAWMILVPPPQRKTGNG